MPSFPELTFNPVDVVVVLLVVLYAVQGFQHGWLLSVVELAGLALALFVAFGFYAPVAHRLVEWTALPYAMSKPLAFLLMWGLSEVLYGLLIRRALAREWRRPRRSAIDRVLGAWPGSVRGLLVAMVLLAISGLLPFPEPLAGALRESRANQALGPQASVLATQLGQIFGDAVQETIGLLTVKPESTERVNLHFRVPNPPFDPQIEARMLELVNRDRESLGLRPLQPDETLRDVARGHSRDMLERGYFAHLSPEGQGPFERMRSGGAQFLAAGENLALAPTVDVAHTGLMNSPGHRANILSPAYGRAGIGVAEAGLHGKMFTQVFAN